VFEEEGVKKRDLAQVLREKEDLIVRGCVGQLTVSLEEPQR
jgi:hypothetical protein